MQRPRTIGVRLSMTLSLRIREIGEGRAWYKFEVMKYLTTEVLCFPNNAEFEQCQWMDLKRQSTLV